ncbi:MAG: hypothetical protein Kow0090_03990 [Myxococcota bacterium]
MKKTIWSLTSLLLALFAVAAFTFAVVGCDDAGTTDDDDDVTDDDSNEVCGVDLSAVTKCWDTYCEGDGADDEYCTAEEETEEEADTECTEEETAAAQCQADNFECDPATGGPTADSAAAIAECIGGGAADDDDVVDDDDDVVDDDDDVVDDDDDVVDDDDDVVDDDDDVIGDDDDDVIGDDDDDVIGDDDDDVEYCDAGESCDLVGTFHVCLAGGQVPSDTTQCDPDTGEGCAAGEIALGADDGSGNLVCVCLTLCDEGTGKYGDAACSAGTCTENMGMFLCLENGGVPATATQCDPDTGEGCAMGEFAMGAQDQSGNIVCVCIEGC